MRWRRVMQRRVFTSPVNDIFHLLNNSHLEITDARANKSNEPIRTPCASGAKHEFKLSHFMVEKHLFGGKLELVE